MSRDSRVGAVLRSLRVAALVGLLAGAAPPADGVSAWWARAETTGQRLAARFRSLPPLERVGWGGLTACALLGVGTVVERSWRLRRGVVVPSGFSDRFERRLMAGELDAGKSLDYCELNPSPAARVALAAVRRWARPVVEQERAVAMAVRVEAARLRRNLGTLRRVALVTPLVGLLGTLGSAGEGLSTHPAGSGWEAVVAAALGPLTAGVALAILALVGYDGLAGRLEALIERLERIGAETIDAIAQAGADGSRRVPRPHGARDGREHTRMPHAFREVRLQDE